MSGAGSSLTGGGTGKAVIDLHEDLKKWQKSNRFVAWVMVALTVAMILLVGLQIYLEFFKSV